MADDSRSPQLAHPLEPDVALPARLFARRVALPESERRLRLAILEDALRYCRDYADTTDRRARAFRDDAVEWLASRDRSEPFSFENICDALALDASAIRRSLRTSSATPPLRALPRGRPHRHAA